MDSIMILHRLAITINLNVVVHMTQHGKTKCWRRSTGVKTHNASTACCTLGCTAADVSEFPCWRLSTTALKPGGVNVVAPWCMIERFMIRTHSSWNLRLETYTKADFSRFSLVDYESLCNMSGPCLPAKSWNKLFLFWSSYFLHKENDPYWEKNNGPLLHFLLWKRKGERKWFDVSVKRKKIFCNMCFLGSVY